MRRRKHTLLGHHMTRKEMLAANAVLAAHNRPQVAVGKHGKLPNVGALLVSLNGMELARAVRVLNALTRALDGKGP